MTPIKSKDDPTIDQKSAEDQQWENLSEAGVDNSLGDQVEEDLPPGYPYKSWKQAGTFCLEFLRGFMALLEGSREGARGVRPSR